MRTVEIDPIWNGRWQTLKQHITDVIAPLESKGRKKEWETTLESTLKCLRAFGEKQFKFFLDGFQAGRLVDSPQLVADYAIRQTLDQISFDLAALRKIQSQRHPDLRTDREYQVLKLADQLAHRALQPAIDAGLIYPTAVLTYFQKAAHVRVIPYAPVALIGIPYTCTGILDREGIHVQTSDGSTHTARDFLAVAHEVGHHIFWHGKVGEIPLRAWLYSQLPAEPTWRMNWLEEIFADVYGAMIAGPILALDFQELLHYKPDLFKDDGEHPVGAIRPFLYTDVLRQLKDQHGIRLFTQTPDKLDARWREICNKRSKSAKFRPKGASANDDVSLYQTRVYLGKTIEIILEALQTMELRREQIWSTDSSHSNQDPYETFRGDILKSPPPVHPKFEAKPAGSGFREVKVSPEGVISWEEGKPLTKWFSFLSEANTHNLILLPETWSTLLVGGGWAAGGPEEDGEPK